MATPPVRAAEANGPRLLARAAEVMAFAYAPYSGFRVGAALLGRDAKIYVGCNVENASYGLTLCAERVAITAAVAAGTRVFQALAIVSSGEAPPYPCGACRQVLAEFCAAEFPVFIAPAGRLTRFARFRLEELLPHRFTLTDTSGPGAEERNRAVRH